MSVPIADDALIGTVRPPRSCRVVRPSPGFAGRVEYRLLHPEEVVRRTTLLEKVWDLHFDPESNVVDVHIKKLRRETERSERRAAAGNGEWSRPLSEA